MDVEWSVRVVDADTGEILLDRDGDRVLRTASVAKLLLLTEVAVRLDDGRLSPDLRLRRDVTPPVADSGLWHLMRADELPLADVCLLVASVSDNWATNVLLDLVGLDAVTARTESLGLRDTRLLDLVRDHRGSDDPPTLSVGSAAEWVPFLMRVHHGTLVNRCVSEQLRDWMDTSVDHSLVASVLAEDPLVATSRVRNKTGSDEGVRADVGIVTGRRSVVYAAVVGWAGSSDVPDDVVRELRSLLTEGAGQWASSGACEPAQAATPDPESRSRPSP